MSMLMSFYLLTPFVKSGKTIISQVCIVLLFFLLAILYNYYNPNGIDIRFFWCFPLYSLGLIFPQIQDIACNHLLGICLLFFMCILIFFVKDNCYQKVTELLIIPMGVFSCLYCCKILMTYIRLPFVKHLVKILAYCSMSAYLFHREIYFVLGYFYRVLFLPYIDMNMFALIMIVFPLCVFFSYIIQCAYDKYIILYLNKFCVTERVNNTQ